MWDHIPVDLTRQLIEWAMRGTTGLAPMKWTAQLEEIRGLDETTARRDLTR